MVFLPEACDYISRGKEESMSMAESIEGETISKYKDLARTLSIWLSIGGFHQKVAGPVLLFINPLLHRYSF